MICFWNLSTLKSSTSNSESSKIRTATDSTLRKEILIFSAHDDHVPPIQPINPLVKGQIHFHDIARELIHGAIAHLHQLHHESDRGQFRVDQVGAHSDAVDAVHGRLARLLPLLYTSEEVDVDSIRDDDFAGGGCGVAVRCVEIAHHLSAFQRVPEKVSGVQAQSVVLEAQIDGDRRDQEEVGQTRSGPVEGVHEADEVGWIGEEIPQK